MAAHCRVFANLKPLNVHLNSYSVFSRSPSRHVEKRNGLYLRSLNINYFLQRRSKSDVCRTHTCGELNRDHIGQNVSLCGWVEFRRLTMFLTLRDGYGSTQLVLPSELKPQFSKLLEDLPLESVIRVDGIVASRPETQVNHRMKTGTVEVEINDLEVLNPCKKKLPFNIRKFNKVNEPLRLQYRYLDLRNETMQRNLRTRSKITTWIREYLSNIRDFVDVETPTLFCETPGGAREFIVPTRKEGKFYSLTQSPQQFKQLLMIGGLDKYYQIARCYRDESTERDRQPEFTQVDVEMSFVTKDDIQSVIEGLMRHVLRGLDIEMEIPFLRMKYEEAASRYGTDKPDLRSDKDSKEELAFVWIEDFPMFLKSGLNGQLESAHHPFTSPHPDDEELVYSQPDEARSQHYDLVLNGQEIGGGSIRIHDSTLQKYILDEVLKEDSSKLNHLLEALDMGCPPHGGIALGLDRIVSILCGADNMRDVIAFPKSHEGKDLLSGAPSSVSKETLSRYHILRKKSS